MSPQKKTFLKYFSVFTTLVALLTITLGASVKSNNAGLAVPDWPTTYGQNMFLYPIKYWVGGIFYEHFHRIIASVLGFLTIILAVSIFIFEKRNFLKKLSVLAIILVIIQGVLGGITVKYGLPDFVSAAHGILAQTFFLLLILISYHYFRETNANNQTLVTIDQANLSKTKKYGLLAIGAVYVQLFIGAWMRHADAGLAFTDFPKMGGSFLPIVTEASLAFANKARALLGLPPDTLFQAWINIAHRLWALAVLHLVSSFAIKFNRFCKNSSSKASILSKLIIIMLIVQVLLGIATIHSHKNPTIATSHLLGGAVLLGLNFIALLKTYERKI